MTGCGASERPVRADDLAAPTSARAPEGVVLAPDLGAVGFVSAGAGAVVWSAPSGDDARELGLVVRGSVDQRPRRLIARFQRLPRALDPGVPPRIFDVGRGADGKPTVVWTRGCNGRRSCTVHALPVTGGRSRVLTSLPAGARAPVAIDGERLVWVVRVDGCDELRLRMLPASSDVRLGRGTCGSVRHVDLQGVRAAAAAAIQPPPDDDSFPSEAWLSDDTPGEGVRIVQDEDAGYSGPDTIAFVAFDGRALFTTRLRTEGAGQLLRIPLSGGDASRSRLGGSIQQAVARDRGRTFVVDAEDEGRRSTLTEYTGG